MEAKVTIQAMYRMNPELFKGIDIDYVSKDTLIRYIYYKAMDRPLILDNPFYLQDEITLWWEINKDNFKKIWDVLQEDYNPLHNYDGKETEAFHTKTTGDFNNTSEVSAFNSDSMKPDSNTSGENNSESWSEHTVEKGGNLGTTMTQDMLKSEIDVRLNNNFYSIVSTKFNNEFTYYFFE